MYVVCLWNILKEYFWYLFIMNLVCTHAHSWLPVVINEHCLPYLQCKWIWAFFWSNPKVLFLFSPEFNKNNVLPQSLISHSSFPLHCDGVQSFLICLQYFQQQWPTKELICQAFACNPSKPWGRRIGLLSKPFCILHWAPDESSLQW